MGRPAKHDEGTASALLDAGERLLAEGGRGAVSVRRVADQTGTSTRAVYSLFGSKAGLIAGLAVRGYGLLRDALRNVGTTDDPAADLVDAGLHGFRVFAIDRPHLFRLTFERIPASVLTDHQVIAAATETYEELALRIERAQGAGIIDDRPVGEAAFAFHALCQGLAGAELSREPPPVGANFWGPVRDVDAERLWRGALEALVEGLAPTRDGDR